MKNKFFSSSLQVFCFLLAVLLFSCKKNDKQPDNTNNNSNQQDAAIAVAADAGAEAVFNDAFDNSMGSNNEAGLGSGIGVFGRHLSGRGDGVDSIPACVTITVSPETPGVFPKTVTLDFGDGCTGARGHVRKGKIITVFTGRMREAGSTATTTFDNYYFDTLKVEGTQVIANTSANDHRNFTLTVNEGKLIAPSGSYITWNRSRTWEQTEGNGTESPLDDRFSITGNADGKYVTSNSTSSWTEDIIQPLTREFICPWITEGQLKVVLNPFTAVLDYGNGDCDNKAVLTINGFTIDIPM